VRRQYDVLDQVLSRNAFVGSDSFSIADMAIYPWIANLTSRHRESYPFLAGDSAEHPHLAAWFATCRERPSVARGETTFGSIRSTLADATEEERDRVFGRNNYARTT
jgi:glutathione S-transferase